MSQDATNAIVILNADSPVRIEATGQDLRLKLGEEPYGVTLVGDLAAIQRVIIEADRQLTILARGPN